MRGEWVKSKRKGASGRFFSGWEKGREKRYESRWEKQEMTKKAGKRRRRRWENKDKRPDSLPPHSHVTQFTMFWPIMFYSTITDSTVVSSDLISQPISFSNVNTKGEAEPLAASSTHPLLLMHYWLPWKEARKGKQQAIILTPVSPNWNPLTISTDDRGWGDVGMFIPRALFPACCSLLTHVKTWVRMIIKSYARFLCSWVAGAQLLNACTCVGLTFLPLSEI